MTIRRAALALTMTVLFAGTGHAERLHTGGIPLPANQMMMPSGHPLVANNTQVSTNVAAGIGNTAQQTTLAQQGAQHGGGPMVGLDFSGRGPMVTTNVGVNTNVAAGLNNYAAQGVLARQR